MTSADVKALRERLRAAALAALQAGDYNGSQLAYDGAAALEAQAGEIERLREIPCFVESEEGNPGWVTNADAVVVIADARRERDSARAEVISLRIELSRYAEALGAERQKNARREDSGGLHRQPEGV